MCCQDPNRKRLASSHFEGGNLLTSAKRWETSPSVAKRSWIRADELVHVGKFGQNFFTFELISKSHFHFHHTHLQIILRTIIGYSALFCGFMQFCSSKNMTLTCRAPVYLSLLSPNKIYHNIGKCYMRGKKHVTRSRLLCRIVIRILMSPVATAVLQLRQ